MIDGLVKIVDRLIELVKYREEKSRRIFEKLIEPVFNDLVVIHKDYLAMFVEVSSLIPSDGDGTKKQKKKLSEALRYLSKKRIEFETTRIKLRAISQSFKNTKTNEKDEFVRAVVSYLWWTGRDGLRSISSQLVEEIHAAVLRASFPPPGLRTHAQRDKLAAESLGGLRFEQSLPDPTSEDLNKYVGVILFELRQKFARVAEAYAEIFAKVRNE